MEILRPAIKIAIEQKKFTQVELAKLTGLTQPQIAGYLAGKKDLTGASIDKLLAALGLGIRKAT